MPGIVLKVGFPLLAGLITLVASNLDGMQVRDALELAAIVAFGIALILFIVDTEIRISAVGGLVTAGFARIGKLAELSAKMERSSLGPALLEEFLETACRVDGRVNPLLQRIARQDVKRVSTFLRQLQAGGEIAYDGEDREWMLGLTREAESSIDAISLSTVDAGVLGLDGGLWTSDLGIRYLDDQRKAIARKVRIRRIFVVEHEDMAREESFLRVTQMQRNAGVQVRMLDQKLIPDYLQSMIFDFIVFDGVVSYETAAGAPFTKGQPRPGTLRTRMAPEQARVRDLEQRFEQLWERADPERQIDE
ncbi:MAG: hypothetical protein J2P25_01770 [Nocardiopsaceae bacterium]|nr:hypothetical protein [Nocardiopsaceae bacterium]